MIIALVTRWFYYRKYLSLLPHHTNGFLCNMLTPPQPFYHYHSVIITSFLSPNTQIPTDFIVMDQHSLPQTTRWGGGGVGVQLSPPTQHPGITSPREGSADASP